MIWSQYKCGQKLQKFYNNYNECLQYLGPAYLCSETWNYTLNSSERIGHIKPYIRLEITSDIVGSGGMCYYSGVMYTVMQR